MLRLRLDLLQADVLDLQKKISTQDALDVKAAAKDFKAHLEPSERHSKAYLAELESRPRTTGIPVGILPSPSVDLPGMPDVARPTKGPPAGSALTPIRAARAEVERRLKA